MGFLPIVSAVEFFGWWCMAGTITGTFTRFRLGRNLLPVPKSMKELRFYVQRALNANTVVYELNRTFGSDFGKR